LMQFGSAVAVPAFEARQGVGWGAVDVDLEVEVAADRDRIAGLADGADALALPDAVAPVECGWAGQVSVEVAALLAFAVDQQVVAVEDRVIAGLEHAAIGDRDQRRLAGGDDVEALVGAAAAAGGAEFSYVAAGAVRALDREDVVVVGGAAVGRCEEVSRCRGGQGREEEKR
jgi:hypothetical protein